MARTSFQRMNTWRLAPVRLMAAMCLLAGVAPLSCGGEETVSRAGPAAGHEPDQIFIRPRIVITENGLTSAVLRAETVKVFEDSSYTLFQDSLTVFFYSEDGQHTTTMTADSGEVWGLYEEVDSLRADGDVRIISEEREASLEAPAIRWIVGQHRVYGEGLVKLNTDQGFEQGTGFTAVDDLSEYEFTGPVSGEVRGDDLNLEER